MRRFWVVAAVLLTCALPLILTTAGLPATSELKIGAVLPLTGAFGASGNYFKQGYSMAIDDVNKNGGLQVGSEKDQITLTILDDGSDGTRSRSLVEKLVTDQHVNFLLGGYDTSLVEAQEVVPDQYKIPYVEGGGAASEIFKRGYKYIFGTLASIYNMGKFTMGFIAAQQSAGKLPKPLTIALVWENTDHGKDYEAAVIEEAQTHPDLFRIALNQIGRAHV